MPIINGEISKRTFNNLRFLLRLMAKIICCGRHIGLVTKLHTTSWCQFTPLLFIRPLICRLTGTEVICILFEKYLSMRVTKYTSINKPIMLQIKKALVFTQ